MPQCLEVGCRQVKRRLFICNAPLISAPVPWRRATHHDTMLPRDAHCKGRNPCTALRPGSCCAGWAWWHHVDRLLPAPSSCALHSPVENVPQAYAPAGAMLYSGQRCACAGAWVHLPYWSPEAEGCRDAEQSERCSSCAVEVIAPWRSLACLTPDATQLAAGPDWGPKPFR